jgi:hypothetical protein
MKFYGGTVTGSLTVNGTQTINGTLTAQTLVVQTITSSISRITGSTSFGSSSINNHNFTGSLIVSGAMFVSSGNVGIGTTTPDIYSFGGNILTLSSATTYSNIVIASSGSNNSGLQLGNQTIRRSSIESISGSHLTFLTNNTDSGTSVTERMRITSTGYVGIGTALPATILHVASGSGAGGTTYAFLHNTSTAANLSQSIQLSFGVDAGSSPSAPNAYIKAINTGGNNNASAMVFGLYQGNVSGTVIEVMRINTTGSLLPGSSGTQSLGSSALSWANIYTNDLHLSNEGKEGGNDVDGTTGDWTIQEGEENLYIINNKTRKKYKFNLTKID